MRRAFGQNQRLDGCRGKKKGGDVLEESNELNFTLNLNEVSYFGFLVIIHFIFHGDGRGTYYYVR